LGGLKVVVAGFVEAVLGDILDNMVVAVVVFVELDDQDIQKN
jgi:hypothetical protein